MVYGHNQINLTPEEEEEACLYAMQLATASVLPMVLKAIVELDVLEIIAAAGQGAYVRPAEIASQIALTNTQAPIMLDRMLRLLASYKILSCNLRTKEDGLVERLYGLAPVCNFFVKNEEGVSMASSVLMMQDKVQLESWHYLKEAVLDGGIPFNKAYGMTAFEYFGTDPRFNKVFNKGMADQSAITMKKILDMYTGFHNLKCLVDVGGGTGAVLNTIITRHPTIEGINFDLPHVIADATKYPGVEHVGGDMFVSVPKGDAIFMKWILHDWSDEHCSKILRNCFEALPENGKVIIAECILPTFPETNAYAVGVSHADNIMLVNNPGGKERTEKDFEALSSGAGFSSFKVICSAFNTWIMEFCK